MIILNHYSDTRKNNVFHKGKEVNLPKGNTFDHIVYLAQQFPSQWLAWSDRERKIEDWKEFLDRDPTTYSIYSKGMPPQFLGDGIDYLEDSPYLHYQLNRWYPTWIMSAQMGMIHSSLVHEIPKVKSSSNFDYDLNKITRSIQNQGIFCYSKLEESLEKSVKGNPSLLYRFISETQKKGWLYFLLMCHFFLEKRFSVLAFAKALFYKVNDIKINVLQLQENSSLSTITTDYDVIIPTMGRADYLKNVFKDLAKQKIAPQKVIVVEQNPDNGATTDLNYIKEEEWPFQIVHKYIHQTGACNARNLGLKETDASWVLFFDDDVRFDNHLIESVFKSLQQTKSRVINLCCLQKGEIENQKTFKQWSYFGSGCSIVHRDILQNCSFDMALEHGYGEDVDYGMQIRNAGYDVIYAPQIQILHLKAPIGGFRKPVSFIWDKEEVKPKPSPQIMYYRKKNFTSRQVKGYQLVQFFKWYRQSGIKNPIKYYKKFKKAWSLSESYANQL